ncbi:MAG TPA: IPT/TIG domain-containing protein [Kofleriaceae bacterium]|jgi:hypothetical protein|nr:IPT/TIG domain-containing protein [Kofleriaceae bacterium]
MVRQRPCPPILATAAGAALAAMAGAAVAGALGGCSANDDVPSPMLSNVQPDHASPGALVTLTGDHFCQQPQPTPGDDDEGPPVCDSTGDVHFGAAPGTPAMWSDTQISVEVPDGISGRVDLTVIAGGRASNAISFTAD